MIIEIRGTGSHNKGAEMMLLTILQQLPKDKRDIKFTVAPRIGSCEYSFYSKLSLYPKVWLEYKGFQFGVFGKFLPQKIRQMYGLIIDEEVDVVLDASGFAYGEQWGVYPSKMMAKYIKQWKNRGKKVILMPQAFGPFRNKSIKPYIREIIENADLVYARDEYSYQELMNICPDAKNIKIAPDFTILLKGEIPSYFDRDKHQICIIPNKRMLDKMNDSIQYINVLTKSINYIQKNILNPFFLIQGGKKDLELAKEINNRLETKIPIINEENPIYIKGIIQSSLGLVGSRFHSIASALYAAKVAIGTGWTHKYEYLYREFDFVEGFINLKIEDEKLYKTLGLFIDENKREYIREKLIVKSKDIEKQAIQMFDEIKTIIGFKNENSAHSRR